MTIGREGMTMPINSRAKGAAGEREWAAKLGELFGLTARRGRQYSGDADAPDVIGSWPGTHPEVKRTETLSVYKAMDQAARDCGDKVPYVAHRRNRREWLVIVRADDLVRFVEAVNAAKTEGDQ